MERQFTTKEIRALAEAERMMDAGQVPFVNFGGQRVMMRQEVMDELGLKQSQTINNQIFMAILQQNLAYCEAQIAIEKAKAAASRS